MAARRVSQVLFLACLSLLLLASGQSAAQDDPGVPSADASAPPPSAPPAQPKAPPDAAAASGTAPASAPVPPPPDAGIDAPVEPPPPSEEETRAVAVKAPSPFDLEYDDELPPAESARIMYRLQRIDVRGNQMRSGVVAGYVPFAVGDELDPNDPALEQLRFQLLGTGFFAEVKLSLERGSRRGWVVLVIEVKERNTLVIERIVAGLSRVVKNSGDRESPVRPYAGLGVAERNLFGTGVGISAAGVASINHRTGTLLQYGLDLRLDDVDFFNSGFDFNARLFHNHAREFFGRNTQVVNQCPPPDPDDPGADCDPDIAGRRAVVIYDRTGAGIGAADDLGAHVRYSLDWLGERVSVLNKPLAADAQRGRSALDREPIDFRIEDGVSVVSSVQLGIIFDTRDHPAQPTSGDRLQLLGRLGLGLLGSDYDFARATVTYEHLTPLPFGHVLQLGLLAGSVFGRAPFFYRFYAADLSELLPSRQLELNLDHRRTHNLLGTSIREMDAEEVAGRIHAEYQLPLRRARGAVRAIDAYLRLGVFLLARREDLRVAVPGYDGLSRLPVDLTFDVGIIADTDLGLFKIGFSSLIGFLPDLGQGGS